MAPGCPAGPRSGLQSRAGTPPKTPSSSGTPHAVGTSGSALPPFLRIQQLSMQSGWGKALVGMAASPPAATGLSTGLPPVPFGPCHHASTWLLPCCPALMLCSCPALTLHCPRMGRGAGHHRDIPSHSSSWGSLGSPDPWLAPQPPNPLCLSSAARSQQEFAESHEHSVPQLAPAGQGQKCE